MSDQIPAPPVPEAPVPPAPPVVDPAAEAEKARIAAEAKAEKEAAKVAKEAEKAAKKADREAKAAEKKAAREAAKAAKPQMPEQNGIRQPRPGSLCAQAWDAAAELTAQQGTPASLADTLELAKTRGLNEGNVRTEYGRWRKFYGHAPVGRKPKEVPPAPPAEAVAPPPPVPAE